LEFLRTFLIFGELRQDLKGHYSYQTCGALDVYNASLETSMFKGVAGRVLKVAVEAFEPYVIERKNIGGEVEYGGFLSGEV